MDDYVPRHEYMERIGRSDDRMRDFDRRLSKVEEFGDKLQSMAISLQGMVVTLQSMQKEQAEQGERLVRRRSDGGFQNSRLLVQRQGVRRLPHPPPDRRILPPQHHERHRQARVV